MQANLTIKCLRQDGMFNIYPAQAVTFWPPVEGTPQDRARVDFDMPDGVQGSFDRGTVYVMNASGKTVETIHLAENVMHHAIGYATAA